jgi:hypothetical protein
MAHHMCSRGPGAADGHRLASWSRTSAWQGWSRGPAGEIMAAQDTLGLGGVVAGGPATKLRHRGRRVRAADDADATVVVPGSREVGTRQVRSCSPASHM